tara:strand:+ start:746 stop:2107 length:1362 start_codon:yes stop_codon:yes gene_type:complete
MKNFWENTYFYCKKIVEPVTLFLIILSFSYWSNPNLSPQISPDGQGYWELAKNFKSEVGLIRPFFFPFFIKLCMIISHENWQQLFSFFQIILHSSLCTLLLFSFHEFGIKKNVSFLLSLLIGFNPNLIYYTNYLLADFLLAILTTLSWIFGIKLLKNYKKKNLKYIYTVVTGIFFGLAVVTKPVSILMILSLIISLAIISKLDFNILKLSFLLLFLNFSFHIAWNEYKKVDNPELKFSIIEFIENGINMTAIRAGLVDSGKDTPLYNYLEQNNLIEEARKFKIKMSYTMDTQSNYLKFKSSLPWDIANDKYFAYEIIKNVPFEILVASISNWHSFFTKRSFFPGNNSFPKMPDFIRFLYVYMYSILYRPFLLILLVISFYIFWKKRLPALFYYSFFLIMYASLITALFTPQGGEFPRYRVWIEYILWFCSLIPFGIAVQSLTNKIKYTWQTFQ